MAIEGTGIKAPSTDASKKATAFLGGFQKKADEKFIKTYERKQEGGIQNSDFETDRYNKLKRKYGNQFSSDASETFQRRDFFSMKTDPRNEVKTASAGDSFNESDYQSYLKAVGIRYPRTLSDTFNRMMKENYRMDKKEGIYKDGQLLNKAPDKKKIATGSAIKEEKPTIGERVASFTGDLFNAFTGTQSAVAQTKEIGDQIFQGGISSNAYSDSITPGFQRDTKIYRGGGVRNDKGQVVTLGKNPSSDGGEEKDNTEGPLGFLKAKPIVREEGQTSVRTKGGGKKVDGNNEPFAADKVGTVDLQSKEYLEAKRINEKSVAPRQTIASLPSDYKATEAEAFRKAEAYQEAKKIAERNPNVTVGVDNKGQPVARAVQQTRDEAGSSARTAEGNQARVKQNAQARAQAAAINRRLSGTTPKTAKDRAQDAAKARIKAGPNRTMSAGQQTRAQAGASARTAQGNRARVKANARKRAQAAARNRRKKKQCDIFLKHDISPLTNMNLIKDDLAEVAYFVKEIQK